MSLSQAKQIFTVPFLQQLDQILINGNYGDFITARDGLEIVEYFHNSNPKLKIIISTNGSGRPNIWTRLAELGTEVHFRLDGLEDTHQLYRQYTNFNLIIQNARKFIAAGGRATWAMIKFNHNAHQIGTCQDLANSLGFEKFDLVDAGRDTTVVFDRDKKFSHIIGDYVGPREYDLLYTQYQHYISDPMLTFGKIKIEEKSIDCYSKKNKEIYISANGEVYPCCWLGFYPLGSQGSPSMFQLRPLVNKNNSLEYTIEETIKWFNSIEAGWDKTVPTGKIYTCNQTCGTTKS